MFLRNLCKRQLMKSAQFTVMRPSIFGVPHQQRGFGTIEQLEKARITMNAALKNEIQFEEENYEEVEDVIDYLEENGFTLEQTDSSIFITLRKEQDGKEIEVRFEAKQPEAEDEENHDYEEEKEQEQERSLE